MSLFSLILCYTQFDLLIQIFVLISNILDAFENIHPIPVQLG